MSAASCSVARGRSTDDQRRPAILYGDDAEATRAALATVLRTRTVAAGGGWLIFALPPAEIAVHPAGEGGRAELYLLCDEPE